MFTCLKNYLNIAFEKKQSIIQVFFGYTRRSFLNLILEEWVFRVNEYFVVSTGRI